MIQVLLGGIPNPASASREHTAPPQEDSGSTLQPEISGTPGTRELVLRENQRGEMYLFRSTSASLC